MQCLFLLGQSVAFFFQLPLLVILHFTLPLSQNWPDYPDITLLILTPSPHSSPLHNLPDYLNITPLILPPFVPSPSFAEPARRPQHNAAYSSPLCPLPSPLQNLPDYPAITPWYHQRRKPWPFCNFSEVRRRRVVSSMIQQ